MFGLFAGNCGDVSDECCVFCLTERSTEGAPGDVFRALSGALRIGLSTEGVLDVMVCGICREGLVVCPAAQHCAY